MPAKSRTVQELCSATDLTPEKAKLVLALRGRNADLYDHDARLHKNKHAKEAQSNWVWNQAITKCGGSADPGAAGRAARLIHGACDMKKVNQDPTVMASLAAANEKVQKAVIDGMNKHLRGDRSLAAQTFSGASMIGFDQMRKTMAYTKDPETMTPVRMTLNDLDPQLSKNLEVPCFDSSHTNARKRKKLSAELGGKSLETDGSCYMVQTLTHAMEEVANRKGKERSSVEVNEMVVGGDAVQVMKSGHVNVTNVSLKGTGSCYMHNSPKNLCSLLHWQGGDHFENLHRQCALIVGEMEEVIDAEGIWVKANGAEEEDKYFAKVAFKMSADGAMIAAEEGACSFQGLFPCPWCLAPKDSLALEHPWPKKDYAYLCNASHMPDRMGGPNTPFKPFTCPIPTCKKRFNTQAMVDNEAEFEGQKAKDFKRTHDQYHKRDPVFPLQPCWQIIPCTLHYLMGCTKHCWSLGISNYIATEEMGKAVTTALKKKCKVCLNVEKVSKGNHAKAARIVSIGGEQARQVVAHYELFLLLVYGWPADFDKDDPPAEVPDILNEGETCAVTAHDLEEFKKGVRVGDALLRLWNCISARMHERVDANGNRLPGTAVEIEDKADSIYRCEKMYRIAFAEAFGAGQFKPYTHIGMHLPDFQRNLQYDLKDYSSEAQEHSGKEVKTAISVHSNKRLSVPDKLGRKGSAYLEQASTHLTARKYVEGVFPEICAKSYEVKRRRCRDDIQQRIVKQEKWSTNVCASSQSETLGEEPEGCEEGGGVAV